MYDLWAGNAAGGSGDRPDAARPIADAMTAAGRRGVITFENLAERTLGVRAARTAQRSRRGLEPLLVEEVLAEAMDVDTPHIATVAALTRLRWLAVRP